MRYPFFMQLRFRVPEQKTRVLFHSRPAALKAALEKRRPWVLVDKGVPLPFVPAARGLLEIAGGEGCKRWPELERILRWLAENKAERGQTLVVIGGGAALDLGALAASLYRRGMRLVLVPTTLLAMVDATLGGKTAVDLEAGGMLWKNFAGTFYPAEEVWVLPGFLATLPARERVSGAGECLKTLWIAGASVDGKAIRDFVGGARVTPALSRLVRACLEAKRKVVQCDPLDTRRIREVLNFGHTAGHAIESATGLSHGESVLWGMAVESALLGRKGERMQRECAAALAWLELALPRQWEAVSAERWLELLAGDKKMKSGKIELSLLERPGKVNRVRIEPGKIASALREYPESFRRAGAHRRE